MQITEESINVVGMAHLVAHVLLCVMSFAVSPMDFFLVTLVLASTVACSLWVFHLTEADNQDGGRALNVYTSMVVIGTTSTVYAIYSRVRWPPPSEDEDEDEEEESEEDAELRKTILSDIERKRSVTEAVKKSKGEPQKKKKKEGKKGK